MHEWREKYMVEQNQRFDQVDAHFKKDDEAFAEYQNQVEATFQ